MTLHRELSGATDNETRQRRRSETSPKKWSPAWRSRLFPLSTPAACSVRLFPIWFCRVLSCEQSGRAGTGAGFTPRRCSVTRLRTAHARGSKGGSEALTKGRRHPLRAFRALKQTGNMVVNESVYRSQNMRQWTISDSKSDLVFSQPLYKLSNTFQSLEFGISRIRFPKSLVEF